MIAALQEQGLEYSETADSADLIIVNTCGFIQSAKEESLDSFFELREQYPDSKVILAGCLAQRYKEDLKESLPEADAIIGNKNPAQIIKLLPLIFSGEKPVAELEGAAEYLKRGTRFSFPGSSYVKIAEGCNNRCTYCAIPLIRGDVQSRSVESILQEIKDLLAQGVFEMNLIAQDLGSFGVDKGSIEIVQLLKAISGLEGDFWIRLLYIHPDNFPWEILDICKNDNRILPYFDLPFQHASKEVLSRMGRKGDIDTYIALIEGIRNTLPDAVIRSTFLVGFPGESDDDFAILREFQEKARVDWLGVFTYSVEDDTVAAEYAENEGVPEETALARKAEIESVQTGIAEQRLDRFVNRKLQVLIEEKVEEEELYIGRAFCNAPEVDGLVVVHSDDIIEPGSVVTVKVIRRNNIDLEASVI